MAEISGEAVCWSASLCGINLNNFAVRMWLWYRLSVLLQSVEVELDGLSDKRQNFIMTLSNRNTTG
jgi:hypothetical protein